MQNTLLSGTFDGTRYIVTQHDSAGIAVTVMEGEFILMLTGSNLVRQAERSCSYYDHMTPWTKGRIGYVFGIAERRHARLTAAELEG